ncbi:MAG: hypothetical protein QG674_276 [Patescibacteria group bacterium]|nr:hypothetical protein [Patescibacteria group bacterium]
MLAIVSTILFSSAVYAQFLPAKDTCPCPKVQTQKPVKMTPPAPRPWRYVVEEKKAKGIITKSFNDSIVVEDYAGSGTVFPGIPNVPERFLPPTVSNLKEVNGSFNRHITFKRMPAPECRHQHYYWYDDLGWLWFLLFFGLIVLVIYMLTRQNQTPITIQNNIPPTPPATPGHRAAVAPAVDIKEIYKEASATGSTVVVYPDGGFKIVPPVKKEEKPTEVKPADSSSAGETGKQEVKN